LGDGVSSLLRTNAKSFLAGDDGISLTGEIATSGRTILNTGSSTTTPDCLHPGVGLTGETAIELQDELARRGMVAEE
jgi:hypothetical protein